MSERSHRPLLFVLAAAALLLDQATKYGVFAWLAEAPGHRAVVFDDPQTRDRHPNEQKGFFLRAERDGPGPHVNRGALFGTRLGLPEGTSNLAFAVISLLAALAIVFWSWQPVTARDRTLCIALGLILGGTLGNLYDRLLFQGVRDFLHWNYLFDWPVFNVADCCLVCGACLMLLQAFLFAPLPASEPRPPTLPVSRGSDSQVITSAPKG
jgi:lipoprotein signal peptidase